MSDEEIISNEQIAELVKQLRDFDHVNLDPWGTMEEAADLLEALAAEREKTNAPKI